MAKGQDSQEKTEHATPKRLREARKKGQVAKSRDLTTVFVMIVVFLTIAIYTPIINQEIQKLMTFIFTLIEKDVVDLHDMAQAGRMSAFVLAKVLLPILLAGVASAILIGFIQVGAIFSSEPLIPKFEKLNPIEGAKNMFKMVTFIELLKNIAKLSLVIYLAYITIKKFLEEILYSSHIRIEESLTMTGEIVYSFFMKVAGVFFVIALIDMGVQRWNFLKNMRMSKDEIKREYKQDEGDPKIKGERRRLHREMVFGDVRANVKKANAVVTNPIEVAVAIGYKREEMAAPEILVKGQRKYAQMIIQVAKEEGIPIVRNIPLAWSLLLLEEGDAIPEDLFEPVAEVLCFVYELHEKEQAKQKEKPKEAPQDFNPLG